MKTERLEMRVQPELVKAVEDWRRAQPTIPSRNEALIRLLKLSLGEAQELAARWLEAEADLIADEGRALELRKAAGYIRQGEHLKVGARADG